MSAPAIFLSYASQDGEAAQRLSEALRAAGLDVWFDRSELRGGEAWDARIRQQIRDCALFIALISAHTDARSEGYFRREWHLAVDRALDMADNRAFLLPVVIDDTTEAAANVPERFRERQWTRLKDGMATAEFVARVAQLLAGTSLPAAERPRAHPAAAGARVRNRRLPVAVATVVAIVAAGAALWSVRRPDSTTAAPAAPAVATVTPPAKADASLLDRKSIAVLPFANLGGRAEDAYLADGLHEEVLSALARLRDLKVISRTSVMEYKDKAHNMREIAQRLGVGTVLEGSVRREGNRLRLTVQLVDANTDRHLLSTSYDRDMQHLLDLQSAVARQVAEAMSATLTRPERGELDRIATNSGDAYDRYLRAVAQGYRPTPEDPSGYSQRIQMLKEALRFDPDYADAHALLSKTHMHVYFSRRHREDAAAARHEYERALAIEPQSPEARLARGMYAMWAGRNLDQAIGDLSAVVQARPNWSEARRAFGWALRRRGRFDEALDQFERASNLSPRLGNWMIAETLAGLRRYDELIKKARSMISRDRENALMSRDADIALWYLILARTESYVQHSIEPLRAALRDRGGMFDSAAHKVVEAEIASAEGRYLDAVRLLEAAPVPPEGKVGHQTWIGFLYFAAGDRIRAEEAFRAAERFAVDLARREPGRYGYHEDQYDHAIVQSMLGKHAKALATIDAARTRLPESVEAVNNARMSFIRSVILVRAGRTAEGYAEVERLLHKPYGAPYWPFEDPNPVLLILKDDPHYDELINRPPRL